MRPRARSIVVLAAAVAGTALTARLGVWQLDRAARKNAAQALVDARRQLPPLPAAALARTEDEAKAQWQRAISVRGRWMDGRTVYLDNRPMDGRVGFVVVTPLALADGTAVAVQRGWLPRDMVDRTKVQALPLPTAEVDVAGRIAPPPGRLYEFKAENSGRIRQNLDLGAWAGEIGRPLRPLSIVQEAAAPDGLSRDWPAPAADVQKHYGYAFQWFAMATLIAGLYVWFRIVRPLRRSR